MLGLATSKAATVVAAADIVSALLDFSTRQHCFRQTGFRRMDFLLFIFATKCNNFSRYVLTDNGAGLCYRRLDVTG
jgi:hypothetical protein